MNVTDRKLNRALLLLLLRYLDGGRGGIHRGQTARLRPVPKANGEMAIATTHIQDRAASKLSRFQQDFEGPLGSETAAQPRRRGVAVSAARSGVLIKDFNVAFGGTHWRRHLAGFCAMRRRLPIGSEIRHRPIRVLSNPARMSLLIDDGKGMRRKR